MEIRITLTWSKLMALVVLLLAFAIDFTSDKQGTVFMYALPFATALITGKQVIDMKRERK